jgi:hypothetical protein
MHHFILCWHRKRVVEEVEAARIDQEWLRAITFTDLDVLRIKGGRGYVLDSSGTWSPVPKAKSTAAYS